MHYKTDFMMKLYFIQLWRSNNQIKYIPWKMNWAFIQVRRVTMFKGNI